MIKLSDYIMKYLLDYGVKHVFMVAGGGAMHLDDLLGKCKDLTPVCCLHEHAASIAAQAYAQAGARIGVALVTTGPGGTNSITGVAAAWVDSVPLLVISGQVKRSAMVGTSGLRSRGLARAKYRPRYQVDNKILHVRLRSRSYTRLPRPGYVRSNSRAAWSGLVRRAIGCSGFDD